jgi:hypothetical protein
VTAYPAPLVALMGEFGCAISQVSRVGSRETCRPPPTDTDEDWLILVDGAKSREVERWLVRNGWEVGGSHDETDSSGFFVSLTKRHLNFILTTHCDFHHRFLIGTSICRRLNLQDKADRVAVVRACREMEMCEMRDEDKRDTQIAGSAFDIDEALR